MLHLPERKALDELSEDKIRMVYALADKMPDETLRGLFKEQLRHRLKKIRPLRKLTAERLFCLPFESLLSNDVPRPRQPGAIPRACVNPLWAHVLEHLDDVEAAQGIDASGEYLMDEPCPLVEHRRLFASFAGAVQVIRDKLGTDRQLRAGLAAKHPDLPDVIQEVHALYQMRDAVMTARRQIQASEQLVGIGDQYVQSVMALGREASLGKGGDQSWYKLFFMVLLMDQDLADHTGPLIEALAENKGGRGVPSVASDLCEALVNKEGETLKAGFAMPLATPDDLNGAADQVRAAIESLGVLRVAAPHLNQRIGQRIDKVETRIHDFLGDRFTKAAEESVTAFTSPEGQALPTPDQIKDLTRTILAISKVNNALRNVLEAPADLKALTEETVAVVGGRLDQIAASRAGAGTREKQDALSVAVQVARSLEPISNEDTVMSLLEDCAVRLGFAESADPTQFFLKIIHAMNANHA
ncbi:hypothetical protein N825_04035 [Skermanella stibiiresistens SB22]|uniref:Uncharacterized protein n=1 Tax=Skermanella stibiiresistens SB22 TaxID=1385369 RepID=W9H7V4_9PROT|nr:hypothetical protein [Skermanella stibiiresistens]EWY39883.1 hypothetical protein N825_04035 [Skermanella stibiiresistens SB22]